MQGSNSVPADKVETTSVHGDSGGSRPTSAFPIDLMVDSLFLIILLVVPLLIALRILSREQRRNRINVGGRLEIVTRYTLERRRSLYLVRVDQDFILIASSELGLQMLTKVGQVQGDLASDRLPTTSTSCVQ